MRGLHRHESSGARLLIATTLVSLGLTLLVASPSDASPSAPTRLVFTKILDSDVSSSFLTSTHGPQRFVAAGQSFGVRVETWDATQAVDVSRPTTIAVTIRAADGSTSTHSATTKGAFVEFANLKVAAAGVANFSAAVTKGLDLSSTDEDVNVAVDATLTNAVKGNQPVGIAGCKTTQSNPTCATLIVPDAAGAALLSTSRCRPGEPCRSLGPVSTLVGQALIALPSTVSVTNPATLVLTCDKYLCGQGGVSQLAPLYVDLVNTGELVQTLPCPAKGVIGSGPEFVVTGGDAKQGRACTDYVQSHRDNAGDTMMYLLFDYDVRVSFP